MDKKIFLRLFYVLFLVPLILFSTAFFLISSRVRKGFFLSREQLISFTLSSIDKLYISQLVCGEDHRFYLHHGCDPIAITRAIIRRLRNGKLEGASTLEQQYVRTCTARYEITLNRKLEEIAISTLLSLSSNKDTIAYSYLKQAFYGHSITGINDALIKLQEVYENKYTGPYESAALISLLKHPFPKVISIQWRIRHTRRLLYIKNIHEKVFLRHIPIHKSYIYSLSPRLNSLNKS